MASVPDSLWWFRLSNENPVRNHVSGRFLRKDENQGWDLFEDLAKKTLQWEPASEKPRNSQSIASRGWLLSLESSIAAEAKIAALMRRIEALEIKEPANVNQINLPPLHNPGCSYCQAPNHVFEECHVFHTQQVPTEHLKRPTHGRHIIPTRKHTITVRGITQISLGPRIILSGLISPTIFTILVLHQIFPVKLHLLPPKVHQWKKNSVN